MGGVTIWYTIVLIHDSRKLLLRFCRFDEVKEHGAVNDVLEVELKALWSVGHIINSAANNK